MRLMNQFHYYSIHYPNFSVSIAFKNINENKSLSLPFFFPAHRLNSLSHL
ncbi:hypothetical protein Nmel_003758 [Mimus melanotis]